MLLVILRSYGSSTYLYEYRAASSFFMLFQDAYGGLPPQLYAKIVAFHQVAMQGLQSVCLAGQRGILEGDKREYWYEMYDGYSTKAKALRTLSMFGLCLVSAIERSIFSAS